MAKLGKQQAQQAVDQADDWGPRGPIEPGLYLATLRDVDSSKVGNAGPYWVWNYEMIDIGDQPKGKQFWDNTSLSEKAIGRLGKVFAAFGASTDDDTDELLGRPISLRVSIRTIQSGARTGEQTNQVDEVLPADTHPLFADWEAAYAAKAATGALDDF